MEEIRTHADWWSISRGEHDPEYRYCYYYEIVEAPTYLDKFRPEGYSHKEYEPSPPPTKEQQEQTERFIKAWAGDAMLEEIGRTASIPRKQD